jgi:hypothetical protein
MKRILLAFLLMLPAMSAIKVDYDPMPPCFPCPPPPRPDPGRPGGVVIEMPTFLR